MLAASPDTYLAPLSQELQKQWPHNRTVNIVCHGHSVPAGYSAMPLVDSFNAYPHLLHRFLKERFPFAVINVIVSARARESSDGGAARFQDEVLAHRPDLVTIDYALNDTPIGLYSAEKAHRSMIESALERDGKVILLAHSPDIGVRQYETEGRKIAALDAQLSSLAQEYGIGYLDVPSYFDMTDHRLMEYMSSTSHPNAQGHALIARALTRWFPFIPEN